MKYEWDSDLETGYERIDNQHKQLFAAVNNMMEASANGKSDQAIMDTLEFLTGYVLKHFTDEEKLQEDYHYPDFYNHKNLHDEFRARVDDMVQMVKEKGPSKEAVTEVYFAIGSWLVNHIKGNDFRMAAFVKSADAGKV